MMMRVALQAWRHPMKEDLWEGNKRRRVLRRENDGLVFLFAVQEMIITKKEM